MGHTITTWDINGENFDDLEIDKDTLRLGWISLGLNEEDADDMGCGLEDFAEAVEGAFWGSKEWPRRLQLIELDGFDGELFQTTDRKAREIIQKSLIVMGLTNAEDFS